MKNLSYDYVVGTGGIGCGVFFRFDDNMTLGRNESRLAELMDTKDFCKLHIILHYIAVYMEKKIPVYAIGRVGNDSNGKEVLALMKQYGIECSYVSLDPTAKTMYSVCFVYPDSDGGNITSQNSASGNLCVHDVETFFENKAPKGRGLVLAAPEVPVETRYTLLKKGREKRCFNVASFASEEMQKCVESKIFKEIDLLAINEHEMEALVDIFSIKKESDNHFQECYEYLKQYNPEIQLIITQGGEGAYLFSNGYQERVPAIWKPVRSTAGAGDCFLATVISGLIYGIPLLEDGEKVGLGGLAALAASIKVTCKDTIDFSLSRKRLYDEANKLGIDFSAKIRSLFWDEID